MEPSSRDEDHAMKHLVFLIGLFVMSSAVTALAQEREMIIPVPQSAYSQAVKVKGGTLVFLRSRAGGRKRRSGCARGFCRTSEGDVGEHAPHSRKSRRLVGRHRDDDRLHYRTTMGRDFYRHAQRCFQNRLSVQRVRRGAKTQDARSIFGDSSDCRVEGVTDQRMLEYWSDGVLE